MIDTLHIIHRADIQAVSEVIEDGEKHFLGEHRDFRRHPLIAKFLPQHARLDIAWVKLKAGEILAPHRHPVLSMIVLTRGSGILLREEGETPLLEGDAILVPPSFYHGFRGGEPEGAQGLSIQFEGLGLYEDIENPRVAFVK